MIVKEEYIELYNTNNETKASIVERLIRTLKTKMWRYFILLAIRFKIGL